MVQIKNNPANYRWVAEHWALSTKRRTCHYQLNDQFLHTNDQLPHTNDKFPLLKEKNSPPKAYIQLPFARFGPAQNKDSQINARV